MRPRFLSAGGWCALVGLVAAWMLSCGGGEEPVEAIPEPEPEPVVEDPLPPRSDHPVVPLTEGYSSSQVVALCSSCHAGETPITAAYAPGEAFLDHFSPATLEDPGFSPDGRGEAGAYRMASWLLSPCAKDGKLDCLACHTPEGTFRFEDEPNRACASCHEDRAVEAASHAVHEAASDGSLCVSCHMSGDHSMRPPTPKASMAYDSPNACNACHDDKSAAWANRWVNRWRGPEYQEPYLRAADLVDAASKGDWGRRRDMFRYIASPDRDEVYAASLLRLLGECDDQRKWPVVRKALDDRSPLVRAAAAEALGGDASRQGVVSLAKAVADEIRLVRVRAAASLVRMPAGLVDPASAKKATRATAEYVASLQARPEDAVARSELGRYLLERGDLEEAVPEFEVAVRLSPETAAYHVDLARALAASGRAEEAEQSLRNALELGADEASLLFELGSILEVQQREVEAADAFRSAFKADPTLAEAAFRLGAILGRDFPADGLRWYRRAAELRPSEPSYVFAVAKSLRESGETGEAIILLNEMIDDHPAFADAWFALAEAYEERGEFDTARGVYQEGSENENLPADVRGRLAARVRGP